MKRLFFSATIFAAVLGVATYHAMPAKPRAQVQMLAFGTPPPPPCPPFCLPPPLASTKPIPSKAKPKHK